jgi:hypothetical protein
MGIKFANSAFATLASGINSSATSITLTTGQGARFPSLAGGDYFFATLIDTSNNLEIVKCTARSTDVLTVVRGQESTTARAFSTGDRIELRITAQGLVDAAPVQSVNGATGAVIISTTPAAVSDQDNTATGYFDLPVGSTAQRPGTPANGMLRYNSTTNRVESYQNGAWISVTNDTLKRSEFTNGTRTAFSDSASNAFWNITVTKDFGSSISDLVVYAMLPGYSAYSDWCGIYAHISGSTTTSTDGTAYKDIIYVGGDASNESYCVIVNGKRFESLGAGTHTLTFGWSTRNGSSSDKWCATWNPDSNNDARQHATRSIVQVYEVAR